MGLFGGKKPKPEEAYQAAKSGNQDVLQGLLDKGCDPNAFRDEFVRAAAPPCAARAAPALAPVS